MKKILFLVCTLFVFSSVGFTQEVAPLQTQMPSSVQSQSATPPPLPGPPNQYSSQDGKTADGDKCDPDKDIMLNINIPFVGRCIKKSARADGVNDGRENSTVGNVFPKLMGGMMRLVMTAIYIIGFLGILVGGFMIAASGASPGLREKGKNMIIMIVGGLILLGASGVILNLINPNFFGTSS